MKKYLIFSLLVVILFAIGCTNMKKYDPLMNDAKTALENAKTAEAGTYSQETLKQAEDAYVQAQSAYENKKPADVEKFANSTIELANKAKTEAETAKKEAERIMQVKSDYNTKLEELTSKIDNIKGEPKYYEKTNDLIEQAKAAFEAGEYDKAMETLTLAMDSYDQGLKVLNSKPSSYKVIRGDCLWNIAKKPKIYGDPFKWPRIYKANKDHIKDPDLIYPNQVFKIPRN
ncbi:DUF4398 domain-containing protein [bacterium]|nr:DUF4398 domain-containing protein [bacterium]